MKNQIDLVFCPDCTQAAVNNDYSGLDYHYNEAEAVEKMAAIQTGLSELGWVSLNDQEFEDEEFSNEQCDCCRTKLAGRRTHFAILN